MQCGFQALFWYSLRRARNLCKKEWPFVLVPRFILPLRFMPKRTDIHSVLVIGEGSGLDFRDAVIQISLTMKTATVRDLRNRFARVAAWISEGEPVEITRAGKLFARLVPATPENRRKLVKPDIMAQLKETWGDRVFSAKEVAEMRAAELEGEEG